MRWKRNWRRPLMSFACHPLSALFAIIVLLQLTPAASAATLETARQLLLKGRYAEASEQYESLKAKEPVAAALGLARSLHARGETDQAVKLLTDVARENPRAASLPAALAELAFERGDYQQAETFSAQALQLDPAQLVARWVRAECYRTAGQLDEALKGYEWFVDFYNNAETIDNPDDLHYIGLAAAQFARWNRLSDQFSFLVNELYPEAVRLEPAYWPAELAAGQLFLEKYNQAEAAKSLKAALAINPNSADVHAALAELSLQNYELDAAQKSIRAALAINPRHPGAQRMQADVHLANFEPELAVGVLEEALKLNPVHDETLGRLAAAYGMVDGLSDDPAGTRMGKLIEAALKRNPHCGDFFYALGGALDKGRKFPHAERYFARAVEVLPQHVGARGQLGLMQMRLGNEASARRVLEESFDIDPFNVRVINSIKVLEVLDEYETLETEHFIIKYDGKQDQIFARHAAAYLEEIYPELCRRLAYTPQEKSLFEIFHRARNTDGHGWFSARMVGLPNIHTIGACAGKMVALTSPTSTRQKFNWARVLKHEFVHVINLQQTNFNIPHWFTEALAVHLEDAPRTAAWNEMLVRRVAAGAVFDLASINLGFIRPSSSEDWQMAYCQAELYAEYMIARFGEDAPGKMLAAYRDNLNTAAAIERSFGVKVDDFERGYTAHLQHVVQSISGVANKASPRTLVELQKAQADDPDNPDLLAELAVAHLRRQQYPDAGRWADKALAKSQKHPLATYVKARLLIVIGEARRAVEMLEGVLDPAEPQLDVLRLLAGLRVKSEDYAAAAKLYELAAQREPHNAEWTKSLAAVYLKSRDKERLAPLLEQLAVADADDAALRQKLAELAFERKDFAAAADWANQALQIDVMDANMHRRLAAAWLAQDEPQRAVSALQIAVELEPGDAELLLSLARAQQSAKDSAAAQRTLQQLLDKHPKHAAASELLKELETASDAPDEQSSRE